MSLRRKLVLCLWAMVSCSRSVDAGDLQPLADDMFLLRGEFPDGRQPDGNSILLAAPAGFVVFDTGRHRSHTQQIIDAARARHRPIAAIVNSHWHLDHIGGNALLRAAFPGVRIFASDAMRGAREGFLKDYRQELEEAIARAGPNEEIATWRDEMALIDAGTKLGPDEIVTQSKPLTIAGRRFVVHLESQAATAGDVWLEELAHRTVLSGDLVTLPVPFLDTACADGWSTALEHIAATPFETLVPGHGASMNRAGFERYRHAFDALRSCAAANQSSQACAQEWIDNLGDVLDAADLPRVPKLMDYYVKLLRGPSRYCTR